MSLRGAAWFNSGVMGATEGPHHLIRLTTTITYADVVLEYVASTSGTVGEAVLSHKPSHVWRRRDRSHVD